MIVNNSIKCDGCGRFLKPNEMHVNFVPDNHFGPEIIEHYHTACSPVVKVFREEMDNLLSKQLDSCRA